MTSTENQAPDIDAATERVRELSEQMISQARQSGDFVREISEVCLDAARERLK